MNPTSPPLSNASAKKLPPTVILLGWISGLTDIASEMAYPLLPLFLVGALKAPAAVLGLVEGFAEALVSVMKGLSGWISDRQHKRVPFIRWGYGLGTAAKPLLALAFTWPLVFLARSIDRFGKGLRTTARDALIADLVQRDQSGRAFGFHRAMDTSGALVGVLLSAWLIWLLPGWYRAIFALAAVPGVFAVYLTFILKEPALPLPPENPQPDSAAAPSAPITNSPPQSTGLLGFSREYWQALGLLMVFALANSSDTFLLLRAHSLGFNDSSVILAYALYNLTYALFSYPAGVLSDRFGRWQIIGTGWILYAAVYFGFAVVQAGAIWLLFAVYGIYMGLTEGVGKALIADYAPPDRKGTALGIFHLSTGFLALLSSLLAGWLWDHWGPSAPFAFGGFTALIAFIMVLLKTSNSFSVTPKQ